MRSARGIHFPRSHHRLEVQGRQILIRDRADSAFSTHRDADRPDLCFMRGSPPGATVRIYYDTDLEVMVEDVIESSGGSLYYVDEIKSITPRIGKVKRYRLVCTKLDPERWEGEPDHRLYWYRRGSTRR